MKRGFLLVGGPLHGRVRRHPFVGAAPAGYSFEPGEDGEFRWVHGG